MALACLVLASCLTSCATQVGYARDNPRTGDKVRLAVNSAIMNKSDWRQSKMKFDNNGNPNFHQEVNNEDNTDVVAMVGTAYAVGQTAESYAAGRAADVKTAEVSAGAAAAKDKAIIDGTTKYLPAEGEAIYNPFKP